jgi:hypothetical protein
MRVLAYCLLNNHFHLILRPHNDGDLSRWMQWLLTSHVRRYHRHYHSSGHVWQGRFKAFPVQDDDHPLTVIRYVERNPLRANLVKYAERWPWSSLAALARASAFHWLRACLPRQVQVFFPFRRTSISTPLRGMSSGTRCAPTSRLPGVHRPGHRLRSAPATDSLRAPTPQWIVDKAIPILRATCLERR